MRLYIFQPSGNLNIPRVRILKKAVTLIVICLLFVCLFSFQLPTEAYAAVYSEDIVDYAARFIGVKYQSPYNPPTGFDCCGFVDYVFSHFGINLYPYDASAYYNNAASIGTVFYNESEALPGDIIAWESASRHVGIYTGPDQMINAMPNGGVKYHGISNFQDRNLKDNPPHIFIRVNGVSYSVPNGSEMTTGYDRVLPDGDYIIASAGATSKRSFYYLDIFGSKSPADNDTNVTLCGPVSEDLPAYDVWTIKYTNGFYTIKQKKTAAALQVDNGSIQQGANVEVSAANGTRAQDWAISHNGNGYRIQARCSSFSLDIDGRNVVNGANIHQYSGDGSVTQSWLFIPYHPEQPIENGRYIIINGVDHTKMIDLPGDTGDLPDQTALSIYNVTRQTFYNSFDITKLSDGYYSIIHAASGKAIEIYGGGSDYMTAVSLMTPNGSIAQQWAITGSETADGCYNIRVKSSGYAMDLFEASTANGSPIVQYRFNGTPAQTWHIVQAEYEIKYDANGGQNAPESQIKYYICPLTLADSVPEYENYMFNGWNTARDGSGTSYAAGDVYSTDAPLTLYAQWLPMTEIKLPAGITRIETSAFENIDATIIRIPEGCAIIGDRAFANNPNLVRIYIPASVTNIAFDAFADCPKIKICAPEGSRAISMAIAMSLPYEIVTGG